MQFRSFSLILRIVIVYQLLLGILVLCLSGIFVIVASIFSLPPAPSGGTAQTYALHFYNPAIGGKLLLIAILLGFISLWGIVAAILLFLRKKGAWLASILWHGLMILPLILLVIATFSGDDILARVLASTGASMSFFSLIYLNKPSAKHHLLNHHQE
jgi:hypothetical protein